VADFFKEECVRQVQYEMTYLKPEGLSGFYRQQLEKHDVDWNLQNAASTLDHYLARKKSIVWQSSVQADLSPVRLTIRTKYSLKQLEENFDKFLQDHQLSARRIFI
jgi:hypothetical protein